MNTTRMEEQSVGDLNAEPGATCDGRLGDRWFPLEFAKASQRDRLYTWSAETEWAWEEHIRSQIGYSIGEYYARFDRELRSIYPKPTIFIFFSRDMACSGHVARVRGAWDNAQIIHYAVHGKDSVQSKAPRVYYKAGAIHVASKYILKKMAEESPLFQPIWQDLQALSPDECGFYLARDPDAAWMESIWLREEQLFAEYGNTRYREMDGLVLQAPTKQEKRLYELAEQFNREGSPELAAIVADYILKDGAGHCNSWISRVEYLLCAGKPEEAYETVRRGMAMYPTTLLFDRLGSRCGMEMKQWAMAERHLKRWWGANPWNLRAMLQYARCLYAMGEYKLCADLYSKCREHRSLRFEDHANLGVALSRSGDHVEALEVFTKMVEEFPVSTLMQNNLAMEMASVGRYVEARKICARLLDVETKVAFVWDTYGFIQLKLRDYAEAETALLKAIELNPDYEWAWRHLLHVYHDSGQTEKWAKNKARVGYYFPKLLERYEKEQGTDIQD